MKIIGISTSNYPNGTTPMSYRLHFYMKALQQADIEVEIVVVNFEDGKGGIHEGINYSQIKLNCRPKRINKISYYKELASVYFKLAKRCEIIFSSEDRILPVYMLTRAVHKAGKKIVFELNENPYSIYSSRIDTAITLKFRRQIFLNFVLPRVDGVIVISHALEELTKNYVKTTNILRIPILADAITAKDRSTTFKNPFILHAGALSEQKDGIKAMLEAFKIVHKTNADLKLVFTNKRGFPALMKWIDDFIKDNDLEKFVIFKGLIPKYELDELYNSCSFAILNKPANDQNNYNFPTKLTELLPRGIPVIMTNTGELKHYFKDNYNALLVEENNAEQIAEKTLYLLNNPGISMAIGLNGRNTCEQHFYYRNYSEKLCSFFAQIAQS